MERFMRVINDFGSGYLFIEKDTFEPSPFKEKEGMSSKECFEKWRETAAKAY